MTYTVRLFQIIVVLVAILCVQKISNAQVQSWVTNPSNGHLYGITTNFYYGIQDEFALSNQPTWLNAQSLAQSYGGNLVTINDAAENAWIYSTFGYQQLLIGFNDYGNEGNWSWISGEPVTYTNWMQNQPDNGGVIYNGEDVAHLNPAAQNLTQFLGMWNDIGNDSYATHPSIVAPMRALIEVVPEPHSSIALIFSGIVIYNVIQRKKTFWNKIVCIHN